MKALYMLTMLFLSFQAIAIDKTIDFSLLFDQPQIEQSEKTIEKKQTSPQVANKAKSKTDAISTPMTLIGTAAKVMYTCDDCTSSGDFISVDFEGVCGFAGCTTKNLKVWGGPGEYKSSYDNASSGIILKGYQNKIAGTYHWSGRLDDKYHCSGTFKVSGDKKNISLRVYPRCGSPYFNEF